MSAWRPIATAPRDGTEVLVWVEYPEGPRACFDLWSTDPAYFRKFGIKKMPEGGQWAHTYLDGGPTHWMPIPDAPVIPEYSFEGLLR